MRYKLVSFLFNPERVRVSCASLSLSFFLSLSPSHNLSALAGRCQVYSGGAAIVYFRPLRGNHPEYKIYCFSRSLHLQIEPLLCTRLYNQWHRPPFVRSNSISKRKYQTPNTPLDGRWSIAVGAERKSAAHWKFLERKHNGYEQSAANLTLVTLLVLYQHRPRFR